MIIAGILFLFPVALNNFKRFRLARFYLCWLPSVIILGLYIADGLKRTTILTSEFDSLYFFLLGVSAIPYLLLSFANKKELFAGLLVPFLFIFFANQIMELFGVGHNSKGLPGDGFDINRMRAIVAYIKTNC
jgi:hypothetical protein